jgi:hypothetical protein
MGRDETFSWGSSLVHVAGEEDIADGVKRGRTFRGGFSLGLPDTSTTCRDL